MARRTTSKKSGLLGKVKSKVAKSKVGKALGLKGTKKRRKQSVTALATELARIKLKRKIRQERLKVM